MATTGTGVCTISWRRGVLALASMVVLASSCSSTDDSKGVDVDPAGARRMLYVGSEGAITWYALDQSNGALDKKGSLDVGYTASFLARSKDNRVLYALLRTVNEMQRQMVQMMPLEGFVASFSIDQSTGALKEIGRLPSYGDRPTYIILDQTGKYVLVANNLGHLVGNSIAVFPINSDGTLGEPIQRLNTGIRAHQIRVHPNNKWVYVPNIDSDNVSQFQFDDKTGMLTAMTPAAATVPAMQGPRHLDFHPSGKYVYLSNEYGATVTTFSVKDDGTLVEVPPAVSGLPADFALRKWQSEIRVAPSGRFVYAGERVHETIAIFEVNAQTGGLTLKGHQPTLGKTPRNFMLDPSGTWMVVGNQESNSLISLRIDKATGGLTQAFGPVDQPTPYVHLFVSLP
jgi:6-phosphogluconolactonase